MTAIQVQAPPLALDPATRSNLLQTVIDTIPYIPNASEAERAARRDAAFALVVALDPRDPVQASWSPSWSPRITPPYTPTAAPRCQVCRPPCICATRAGPRCLAGWRVPGCAS